jgi:predicted permease
MPFVPISRATRALRRSPAFTLTATLTLVVGLAATVAMFAIVDGVLLRPLPYPAPDRLVGAWHDIPPLSLYHAQQTSATYFTYRRLAHTLAGIGVYQPRAVNARTARGDAAPRRLSAAFVSATVLPVLGVRPALGRNFTPDEDAPKGPAAVIISDALWRRDFAGDPGVLGQRLDVDGRSVPIVGVMPPGFAFPAASVALWLPLALDPTDAFPGGFNYDGVARLKPGVRVADAQRELTALLPRIVETFPNVAPGVSTRMLLDQAKPRPLLVPLRQDLTSEVARTLWMVFAAAGLVLLVAGFNVANLVVVRADARQRELAVRDALGAGRARVLGHFLAESAVLAGGAALVAVPLAWACVRALVAFRPADIPRLGEVRVGVAAAAFAAGLAALIAVACSVIPAIRIGRLRLTSALREGGRTGTAGRAPQRARAVLVAAQIALALVVLAGSGLLLRTMQRLHRVRPGFDAEHVATFWLSLPSARYRSDTSVVQFFSELVARARRLPGVESVGLTTHLPLESHGQNKDPFYPENDPSYASKVPPLQTYVSIDSGYFHAMRIPLLAGRGFGPLETQRVDEAIISRATAVQMFRDSTGRSVIGKRYRELPGPTSWRTIVGVVGDVRDTALTAPPPSLVYVPEVPNRDASWRGEDHLERTAALVVRARGEPAAITPAVERVVRELDPTLPTFDVRPMADVVRASTARLAFVALVLGAAAAVTLLLGVVGLYGVMAYLVTLRRRELGVRAALGAPPRAVAAMITRQGVALAATGVGAGLVLFAVVGRLLRAFLYDVSPADPLTLAGAAATLVLVAAAASWLPARRAAAVDPTDALRGE